VISLIGALEYSQCADLEMLDAVFACRLISDTIDINHKVLNEICKRQRGRWLDFSLTKIIETLIFL
jgi:hypothetical protein